MKEIASCRPFYVFSPAKNIFSLVSLYDFGAKRREVAFYRLFYDFSARSAQKGSWDICSARSAEKGLWVHSFGAERGKEIGCFFIIFIFSFIFTVLGDFPF